MSGVVRTSSLEASDMTECAKWGATGSYGHTLWAIKRWGSLFVTVTLSHPNVF